MVSRLTACVAAALVLAGCPPPAPPRSGATSDGVLDAVRRGTGQLFTERYAEAEATLRAAHAQDPNNDVIVYLAAMAAARAHEPDKALAWLARLDELHSDLVPLPHELAAVVGDPRFTKIAAAIAARAAGESRSVVEAFRITELGLAPEGIAYDAATRAFFLGSTTQHKIVRVADGRSADFVPASTMGAPVLGLRVDAARRRLWAASEGFVPLP
jgi:hypothetical protein